MTIRERSAAASRRSLDARARSLGTIGIFASFTLALAAGSASAAKFDFSYAWANGDKITGSFTGTQSGQNVTDISNVSASFNGTPMAGSGDLNVYAYTDAGGKCPSCWAGSGGVASTIPDDNNFLFTNESVETIASGAGTEWFYVIPWAYDGSVEAVQYNGPQGLVDAYNGDFIPGNWSLTAVGGVSGVPEPAGWTLMLVGVGAMGGALRSRRRGANAYS